MAKLNTGVRSAAKVGNAYAKKLRALTPRPEPTKRAKWLLFLLGLDPSRSFWGLKPYDLKWPGRESEAWYQQVVHNTQSHGHHHSGQASPFYEVPHTRLVWGDFQQEIHPGPNELFLDLIFVGVAFRAGNMFKDAIYDCVDPNSSDGSDGSDGNGSDGSSSSSSSSGRRLAGGGQKNQCVGLSLAYLHVLGPFLSMYLLWLVETNYKARFVSSDWLHWVADLAGYFCLVIAGMNMHVPADYLTGRHPNRVQIGLIWALGVWIFRVAEVAVLAKRESSRRQGAADLVALLGVLAIWLGAHYAAYWEAMQDYDNFYAAATKELIGIPPVSAGSGSGSSSGAGSEGGRSTLAADVSVGLLWAGNLFYLAKQLQRPLLLLLFGDRGLGVERTMAPANQGFVIHRVNEFMFLMIGEGVLALVIAEMDIAYDISSIWNDTVLTGLGGFIICIAMCVSFREMLLMQQAVHAQIQESMHEDIEREDRIQVLGLDQLSWQSKETRAAITVQRQWRLRHKSVKINERHVEMEKRAGSVLYSAAVHDALVTFLWQMNAVATMLVGVGIKLAIYKPTAAGDAFFSLEQRLQLNIAVVFVFGIQLLHASFIMDRDFLTASSLRKHPLPLVVFGARFLLLGVGLSSSWLELTPVANMWVQTAFAVAQWVLIHVHAVTRTKIAHRDVNIYFFMPLAFTTLRNKAKRFQVAAGIDRAAGNDCESTFKQHNGSSSLKAGPRAVSSAAEGATGMQFDGQPATQV